MLRVDFLKSFHRLVYLEEYYGSGFSSRRCSETACRCLKIDRQFIQALPESESDLAICKGTILLADALNVKPIAECVETQEQFKALKEIGVIISRAIISIGPWVLMLWLNCW